MFLQVQNFLHFFFLLCIVPLSYLYPPTRIQGRKKYIPVDCPAVDPHHTPTPTLSSTGAQQGGNYFSFLFTNRLLTIFSPCLNITRVAEVELYHLPQPISHTNTGNIPLWPWLAFTELSIPGGIKVLQYHLLLHSDSVWKKILLNIIIRQVSGLIKENDKLLNFIITTENVFPPNKRPGNSFSADNL